jgi:hypothetical protein
VDLSLLDGKRVAIVFQRDELVFVVRGTASYECDRLQGNFLRIPLQEGEGPGEGDPHVIVYDRAGGFTIAEDPASGCDYCVTVTVSASKPATDAGPIETS